MSSAPSSSRSTLITVLSDTAFPDQVIDVAAFLSRSKPEAERSDYINAWQAKASADDVDADAVVEGICAEFKGLGEGLDREIEGVHNLVTALIFSVADSQKAERLIDAHVATISRETGKETVKYRILSNIFNSLPPTSPTRSTVFSALLNLASHADDLDLLSPALASLPHWLAQWSIPEAQKAQLLETVATKLEQSSNGSDAEKAYEFRLAHLQYLSSTHEAAGASTTATASAEKAIASALRLPRVFAFDSLLKLSVVESLSSSSSALFSLLKILVSGSLRDYQSWATSNSAELQRLSIPAALVERKVRLLEVTALCSRALESSRSQPDDASGSSGGAEVPYSLISSSLSIPSSDVEATIIDVIRAGLVSGKLSQTRETFRVYRSTYRSFGAEQWGVLEERLAEWERTISGILATLGGPRGAGGQAQGASEAQAVAAA